MRTIIPAAIAALALAASAEAAPVNLPAWQSTVKYSTTSTGASGFRNYARATSKVVYDAAAGTYVIRDTGSLATTETFGPSNQTATNATFTTYGTATDSFRRLNLSGANPLIRDFARENLPRLQEWLNRAREIEDNSRPLQAAK